MDRSLPAPAPNPLTAPYWAACGRGELAIQRCAGCERFVHFPEAVCPFCGSGDLSYETVSGRGTVHTFTVVHRSFLPGFETPYVLAWVDLAEGGRVFGNVVDCPPEAVRIGLSVEVCFSELEGFGPIPHWRPT